MVAHTAVPPPDNICMISRTEARMEITPKRVSRLINISFLDRSSSYCLSERILTYALTSDTAVEMSVTSKMYT